MVSFHLDSVESGEGETIVLVHGSASDRRTWDTVSSRLSTRYRVVAYSRRYHWPNPSIEDGADYSMPEHVGDLRQLLATLGNRPVHLVGHSYGAFVVLLLALESPDAIRSMVLAEPPAITLWVSNDPKPLEVLKLLTRRPAAAVALMKFGATGISPAKAAAKRGDMNTAMTVFGKAVLGERAFATLAPERFEQVLANSFAAEFLGSGFSQLSEERVRAVRIPTLLLSGEQSPPLFRHLVRFLGELIPSAETAVVPNASHIMHEDNPGVFLDRVESFLEHVDR